MAAPCMYRQQQPKHSLMFGFVLVAYCIGALFASPLRLASPTIGLRTVAHYLGTEEDAGGWEYSIASRVQNGTSSACFNITTLSSTLSNYGLLQLDKPQVTSITDSVFDWWYYDVVSETNPKESIVVILFASSATAFPWLDPSLDTVLVAYLWASFENGTVFSDFVPATLATVRGGEDATVSSYGGWSETGFNWISKTDDLSPYEIIIQSEEMQVQGRVVLTSPQKPHLPCGIQSPSSSLEIFPHIGWASIIPDATGLVEVSVRGSSLEFQGRGYHDKNWSDRPFTESVQSWYWGHGRLGPYSVVWFAGIDTTKKTRTSSYVSRDGVVLVSSCTPSALKVRPIGAFNSTGARYPPQAGDIPTGFQLEFDLGEENGLLRVNATAEALLTGDGRTYFRWSGPLTGQLIKDTGSSQEDLSGVAVFEQFALIG